MGPMYVLAEVRLNNGSIGPASQGQEPSGGLLDVYAVYFLIGPEAGGQAGVSVLCRFEDEDGQPVLYVYEIQLDSSVQRQVSSLIVSRSQGLAKVLSVCGIWHQCSYKEELTNLWLVSCLGAADQQWPDCYFWASAVYTLL